MAGVEPEFEENFLFTDRVVGSLKDPVLVLPDGPMFTVRLVLRLTGLHLSR